MSQSFTLSARVLALGSSNGSLLFAKVEGFHANNYNYGPLDCQHAPVC